LGANPEVGGLALFDETFPAASGDTKGNVSSWNANFGAVAAVLSGTPVLVGAVL
jgi:hypothetical protein